MLPNDLPAKHLDYLLTAYLFENLSVAGRKEVEAHLTHCGQCRAQLTELRATLGMAELALDEGEKTYVFEEQRKRRVLDAARNPRHGNKIFSRLSPLMPFTFGSWQKTSKRTIQKWSWRLGALAALLLVVVVGFAMINGSHDKQVAFRPMDRLSSGKEENGRRQKMSEGEKTKSADTPEVAWDGENFFAVVPGPNQRIETESSGGNGVAATSESRTAGVTARRTTPGAGFEGIAQTDEYEKRSGLAVESRKKKHEEESPVALGDHVETIEHLRADTQEAFGASSRGYFVAPGTEENKPAVPGGMVTGSGAQVARGISGPDQQGQTWGLTTLNSGVNDSVETYALPSGRPASGGGGASGGSSGRAGGGRSGGGGGGGRGGGGAGGGTTFGVPDNSAIAQDGRGGDLNGQPHSYGYSPGHGAGRNATEQKGNVTLDGINNSNDDESKKVVAKPQASPAAAEKNLFDEINLTYQTARNKAGGEQIGDVKKMLDDKVDKKDVAIAAKDDTIRRQDLAITATEQDREKADAQAKEISDEKIAALSREGVDRSRLLQSDEAAARSAELNKQLAAQNNAVVEQSGQRLAQLSGSKEQAELMGRVSNLEAKNAELEKLQFDLNGPAKTIVITGKNKPLDTLPEPVVPSQKAVPSLDIFALDDAVKGMKAPEKPAAPAEPAIRVLSLDYDGQIVNGTNTLDLAVTEKPKASPPRGPVSEQEYNAMKTEMGEMRAQMNGVKGEPAAKDQKEYKRVIEEVDEKTISTAPLIQYPPNWDMISKRGGAQAGEGGKGGSNGDGVIRGAVQGNGQVYANGVGGISLNGLNGANAYNGLTINNGGTLSLNGAGIIAPNAESEPAVVDLPPVNITAAPQGGTAPLTVKLNAASTQDGIADANAAKYLHYAPPPAADPSRFALFPSGGGPGNAPPVPAEEPALDHARSDFYKRALGSPQLIQGLTQNILPGQPQLTESKGKESKAIPDFSDENLGFSLTVTPTVGRDLKTINLHLNPAVDSLAEGQAVKQLRLFSKPGVAKSEPDTFLKSFNGDMDTDTVISNGREQAKTPRTLIEDQGVAAANREEKERFIKLNEESKQEAEKVTKSEVERRRKMDERTTTAGERRVPESEVERRRKMDERALNMAVDQARVSLETGRYDVAARNAEKVLELDPANPDANAILAQVRGHAFAKRDKVINQERGDVKDVPHSDYLVYPEDWREIAKRTSAKPDAAASGELQIYDIRDLSDTVTDFPGPKIDLGTTGKAAGEAIDPFAKTPPAPLKDTDVAALIKDKILAGDFKDPQFTIDVSNGKLVVFQTPENQKKVAQLLKSFRENNARAAGDKSVPGSSDFIETTGINITGMQGLDPNVLTGDKGDVARIGAPTGFLTPRVPATTDTTPPNVPFPGAIDTGEFNFGKGVSSVDGLKGNVKLTQPERDPNNVPFPALVPDSDKTNGGEFTAVGSIVNHAITFFPEDPQTISGQDTTNTVRQPRPILLLHPRLDPNFPSADANRNLRVAQSDKTEQDQRQIEGMLRKGVDVNRILDEPADQPALNAKVLAVRNDAGLVMLSVGAENQVKPGYQFVISKGANYKAKVQVVNVFKDMCAAKIVPGMENKSGLQVESNDDASASGGDAVYEQRVASQETTAKSKSRDAELMRIRINKMLAHAEALYDVHDYKGAEQMASRVLINDPLNPEAEQWKRKARAAVAEQSALASINDEVYLRGFRALREENPKLSLAEFLRHPDVAHPVPLSDEGMDEDDYAAKYGIRPFVDCARDHLSTFGMDVDTASYTLAREVLRGGKLPAPASVRTEEFVNYFKQPYQVQGDEAFGVFAESAQSPFVDSMLASRDASGGLDPAALFGDCFGLKRVGAQTGFIEARAENQHTRELLKIGIKSRPARPGERKPAMLTFVVDTSGSMSKAASKNDAMTRLQLVQKSLNTLVEALNPEDAVSIVGFGDQAELILPRTQARQKQRILDAISTLDARGSTNVEAGLNLGYRMADEAYASNAVNRMILFSDGVANIGAKGPDDVLKLVKVFAARNIDLSTVGVGMEGVDDPMLRTLADDGNGSCHYADTLAEANKILLEKLPPHLNVLARDAKVQVDFNVETVKSYRLLGYEKRKIADKDFRNDKIDSGDVGHDTLVTVFYEIERQSGRHGPLGKVYLRWKDAGSPRLEVVERNYPLDEGIYAGAATNASPDYRFLACVARFAELLRDSKWVRQGSYAEVLAELNRLPEEFRAKSEVREVRELVEQAQRLSIAKWKTEIK